MKFLDTLSKVAGVASAVTTVNPMAGALLSFVTSAVETIDDLANNDKERAQLVMRLVAWGASLLSAAAEACADGELTAEEFTSLKEELWKLKDVIK